MSGPVDVLAVMAGSIETADNLVIACRGDWRAMLYAEHCRQARAAVEKMLADRAELLEACLRLVGSLHVMVPDGDNDDPSTRNLRKHRCPPPAPDFDALAVKLLKHYPNLGADDYAISRMATALRLEMT